MLAFLIFLSGVYCIFEIFRLKSYEDRKWTPLKETFQVSTSFTVASHVEENRHPGAVTHQRLLTFSSNTRKGNRSCRVSGIVTGSPPPSPPVFVSLPVSFQLPFGSPHLLTERAVAALPPSVQLEGLPQQRVERLAGAVDGGGVGRDGEGGHVAHLLQGTLALGRLVQQLVVLQVLGQPLQHGDGLVEVHLQKAQAPSPPIHP